jgi:hypothetical protein
MPSIFAVERAVDGVAGIRQRGHQLAIQIFVILYDKDSHVPLARVASSLATIAMRSARS